MPYIYQISKHKIPKKGFIDPSLYEYESWFTEEIANRVEHTDRDEAITKLSADLERLSLGTYSPETGTFRFCEGFKPRYFQQKYKDFLGLMEGLNGITLEQFYSTPKLTITLWKLKNIHNDIFGDYVSFDTDGDDLETFDNFICAAGADMDYYIGAVLFYKY